MWGKQSLFYFHGSPEFVNGYMAVFFVVLALYTIGFRSRVTGLVSLMMMNGLYNRNGLYLEGTDTVFRVGWFLMIFAHVDAAWSVDNGLRRLRERRLFKQSTPSFDWLHLGDRSLSWLWGGLFAAWFCLLTDLSLKWVELVVLLGVVVSAIIGWVELQHRKARAADGTLAEFDAKRTSPSGEPIRFRLIPAWPRYLLIAQLVCIYMSTGLYKTGDVWDAGDALYYSLNMDHFYRFEGFTQWFSALFSTTLFRWMTWVTLWWEKLFGLVTIGIVLDWGLRHRNQPWYQAMEAAKWRKWLGRLALIAAYVVIWQIATNAYPWSLQLKDGVAKDPAAGLATINRWMFGYVPAIVVALVRARTLALEDPAADRPAKASGRAGGDRSGVLARVDLRPASVALARALLPRLPDHRDEHRHVPLHHAGMPLTAEEEAQLASEKEREAKAAETRRKSWANRRDWGGSGPPTEATRTPPIARPTPADDDTPAKHADDGE